MSYKGKKASRRSRSTSPSPFNYNKKPEKKTEEKIKNEFKDEIKIEDEIKEDKVKDEREEVKFPIILIQGETEYTLNKPSTESMLNDYAHWWIYGNGKEEWVTKTFDNKKVYHSSPDDSFLSLKGEELIIWKGDNKSDTPSLEEIVRLMLQEKPCRFIILAKKSIDTSYEEGTASAVKKLFVEIEFKESK